MIDIDKIEEFVLYTDFIDLICGDLIGEGSTRKTFECFINHSYVIKIEKSGCSQNVREYQNWSDYQYTDGVSEWLAPCHSLSRNGRVLIQRRCEPIAKSQLPEKLPKFLTDLKVENFGMLDGRIVCCDYSFLVTTAELTQRKVKWND